MALSKDSNSRIQRAAAPTKTKAQIEADERAAAKAAQIKSDQISSAAAFKASGLGAAGFISQTDYKARVAALPPVAPATSRFAAPSAPAALPTAPVAQTPVRSKPAPTPPTLNLPDPPQYTGIKSAPIDTIEFIDETFSDNLIIDLLFEDVGGQELLTIARNDTVNGQSVVYQPFKNLGILQETYNATTLLRLQETSDKFFSNFLINLRSKIPNVGRGPNGATFYLESEGQTGNAIIEFINIRSDEQIEIQIASAGIIEEIGI
jgi:hypothetical protein